MFKIVSDFNASHAQQQAATCLIEGIKDNKYQILHGVTGSGKTFTMAMIIEALQLPTLVVTHNKTLAAQLYGEFKTFFPKNAVEYFVSYYDYYQPEAYIPARDLYIEKDASINAEIERLRLSATTHLIERKDVITVATVSCIYGIGNPENFARMVLSVKIGDRYDIDRIKKRLVAMQYERHTSVEVPATFSVRGGVVDVYSAYDALLYRILFDWDEIKSIQILHPVTRQELNVVDELVIYPAKHFVMEQERIKAAVTRIKDELKSRLHYFDVQNKIVERQRLYSRAMYDIALLEEMGFCPGIENYSRIFDGRQEGQAPHVLLDYYPDEFLVLIDESHATLPQLRGMYNGDRARKQTLVEHGFRLPSALDNRPLVLKEFEQKIHRCIFISATPGKEERKRSENIVEQIIRPTGLIDPAVEIRATKGQIEDLYGEIKSRTKSNERVLITTLTKRMAEDLTTYFVEAGLKVRYLHSEVETVERVEILTDLRSGQFDVLIGVNLLREGLDLPEVSLVAILDADKIGFLRSETALIQTIGRASRNIHGNVIMYADTVSAAMKEAIAETKRRRKIQMAYNKKHHIKPKTVEKSIQTIIKREKKKKNTAIHTSLELLKKSCNVTVPAERKKLIHILTQQMLESAKRMAYEEAMVFRDEIKELERSL